ncbi:MAG: lipopolysaccharide biosynthesis protein [Bacteroidia bacterium]|nr:lipopolysaccharide biosynthesis protein [Bacteroidia bacterium]
MSAIKKLASQTAIYGLSSIFGRVVVWGLTPIYTGLMNPGEYGIFSDLYTFVTYFLVILTFGMETTFFRYSSDEKIGDRAYNQAFLFVGMLSSLFVLVTALAYVPLAGLAGYETRPELVLMVIFILFMDVSTSLPMAKLRYDERPMVFAAISLSSIALNVGLNLFFYVVLKKTTSDYVFISNLVASAFKMVLLVTFSLPLTVIWAKLGAFGKKLAGVNVLPTSLKPEIKLLRPMAMFGFYIMLAGLSGMLNQNSDITFLKRIWEDGAKFLGHARSGEEMVGFLSAGKKLAVIVALFTQAFRYAAEPFFFKEALKKDSRETFARVFHLFMMAGIYVFLWVGSFAEEFVSVKILGFQLIDERYWDGLTAIPWLLAAFILGGAYTNISIWFKLTKQVRFGLLFSIVGTLVIVGLHFILIPSYGLIGSSIAMMTGYVVMVILVFSFGQKYYPIPYKIGRIALYSALVLVAFTLNKLLGVDGILSMVFLKKLLITVAVLGGILLIEKKNPTFPSQKPPEDEPEEPQAPPRENRSRE